MNKTIEQSELVLGYGETASLVLNSAGGIYQLNSVASRVLAAACGASEHLVGGQAADYFELKNLDGSAVSLIDAAKAAQQELPTTLVFTDQQSTEIAVSASMLLLEGDSPADDRIFLNLVPRSPHNTETNHLIAKVLLTLDWPASPLAVISWNPELEVAQWNRSATRIFGYSAEQAVGVNANDLIIPKHRVAGVKAEFSDLISQTDGTHGIYENVTASGERIYCEWHNTPLIADNGEVLGAVTVAQDVTSRIDTEQQLAMSEQRFRSYFDKSLTGMSVVDPHLGWIDVNRPLCEMLGYSRTELLATGWKNTVSEEARRSELASSKKLYSGEVDQVSRKSSRIRKDGSTIIVELNTNVVRRSNGEIDYFISQILDITEQTFERKQLDRTMGLLFAISDALPDMVYFKDKNGVYQHVNRALERASLQPGDHFVGMTDEDIFPAELAAQLKQQDLELIGRSEGEDPLEFEGWDALFGNAPRYFNTRKLQVRDREGGVIGTLGITRDDTHLKQVKQALSYSQTIIDLSSDMMALFDHAGVCLSANRAFRQGFLKPSDEIIGKHWKEIGQEQAENHPEFEENYIKSLAGEIITTSMSLDLPGLGQCHVNLRYTPFRVDSGEINGFSVTIHDITELDKAMEGLRRYKKILSATHDLMSFVTLDYTFAAVNAAFELFFGFSKNEIIGTSIAQFRRDGETFADVKRYYDQCISGDVLEFEQEIISSVTGDTHVFEKSYYPYRDENGDITGVVVSARDVTSRRKTEEDLSQYKDIVSASLDYMAMLDLDYRFTAINKRYELYFGVPANEIVGKSVLELSGDPELFQRVFKPAYDRCLSGEVVCYEQKVVHPTTGESDWAEMRYYPSRNDDGEVVGIVINVRDMTEQKQSELKMKQLSQAVELSPSAVMISDAEGLIEYVNPAFERTSGYESREVLGQTPFDIQIYSEGDENYTGVVEKITSGLSWSGEVQSQKKTGEVYWENVFFSPIRNDDGDISHYLAVKEDISLRRQQEEQLERQAYYDPLTDMPNRMLAFERLRQAMVRANRSGCLVAVIFIDLDHFKNINDTLGHGCGDQLLIEASSRLRHCVRNEDTVARLGGDEFLVLLTDLPRVESTQPVIDKIIDCFNTPFRLGSNELHVTASVGISVFPNDAKEDSTLLRNADTAMYHAKAKGRNRFKFFTEEMDAEAHQRLRIETELRNALARNELFLEYQPVVDGYNGHVVGFEALVRWQSNVFGLVPPDKFIPVAEETGLIHDIGFWVLTEACATLKHFREQGYDRLRVAVNVSSKQFQDFALVDLVKEVLHNSDIPAYCLALEVTETLLLEERAEVTEIIHQLTKIGVQLSVDDFGTGYSSLSYLKKYPFNTLKIDRSFVKNIVDDVDDLNLTKAIIAMAHALHLEVIAEGVEDKVQLALLRAESCDYVQGYLFSRPVSAEALMEYIQEQTP